MPQAEMMEQRSALSVPYTPGKPFEVILRLVPVGMEATKMDTIIEIPSPSEKEDEQSPVVESRHVGDIGDRIILRLKMIGMKAFRNMTAVSYKYDFRDMQGNLYEWVTYRDKKFERGEVYDLKCTIKKFYERRGVKITGITRCRST